MYKLSEEQFTFLRDALGHLNMVEVKGGANVGNMFQALARIESVLKDLSEQQPQRDSPLKPIPQDKKEEIPKEDK